MPRPVSCLIKPASSRCNLNCTYCFYLEKQAIYPWSTNPTMSLDTFRLFLDQYARLCAPHLTFAWQGGEPTMMGLDWFQQVVEAQIRAGQHDNLLEQMVLGRASVCMLAPSCGYVVLEHNGDCYPCDFFVEREWKLGNIHETPLETMLEGERFRAFARMKPAHHPQCQSCEWFSLCYGECPRYRFIGNGAAEHQLSYFCPSYKRFFPHAHKRLRRTAETVARDAGLAGAPLQVPVGALH